MAVTENCSERFREFGHSDKWSCIQYCIYFKHFLHLFSPEIAASVEDKDTYTPRPFFSVFVECQGYNAIMKQLWMH